MVDDEWRPTQSKHVMKTTRFVLLRNIQKVCDGTTAAVIDYVVVYVEEEVQSTNQL